MDLNEVLSGDQVGRSGDTSLCMNTLSEHKKQLCRMETVWREIIGTFLITTFEFCFSD